MRRPRLDSGMVFLRTNRRTGSEHAGDANQRLEPHSLTLGFEDCEKQVTSESAPRRVSPYGSCWIDHSQEGAQVEDRQVMMVNCVIYLQSRLAAERWDAPPYFESQ